LKSYHYQIFDFNIPPISNNYISSFILWLFIKKIKMQEKLELVKKIGQTLTDCGLDTKGAKV